MNKDLTRQTARYPRGLVIATAEQWISGESLNARLFGVAMRRGDVNLFQLSLMQEHARNGLLARCMADFIQGLASNRAAVIADCREQWQAFRGKALAAGLSGRAPEQVAFLLVGARLAANHYRACGVAVDTTGWVDTLFELARRHEQHVLESQPADRFRAGLRELLAAGGAYLESVDSSGNIQHGDRILRGQHIGWINDGKNEVYLLSAPVMETVNESLRRGDTGLNIRPAALWRQCRQRGWLLHGDVLPNGSERSSRVCRIAGTPIRVLVFDRKGLLEGD